MILIIHAICAGECSTFSAISKFYNTVLPQGRIILKIVRGNRINNLLRCNSLVKIISCANLVYIQPRRLCVNYALPGMNITLRKRGGGGELHQAFNVTTQTYGAEPKTASVLQRLTANSYKKVYPDGWKAPRPYLRIVPQPKG